MNTSWFGVVVGQGLAQRDHRTVSSAPWGVVLRPPSFPWLESLRRPCRCDSDAHNLGSDIYLSRGRHCMHAPLVGATQERFRYAVQADFVVTRIRPLPSSIVKKARIMDGPKEDLSDDRRGRVKQAENKEGRVKNRHTNQRPRTCAGHVQRSRSDSAVVRSPPPDPRGFHSPTRGRRVAAFRRVQLPARARRPVMTSLSKRQLPLALSSSAANQHVTSLPPMWIVNMW